MRRYGLILLACVLTIVVAGAALAQGDAPPPVPAPAPKEPAKIKRVIHAIELATSKKQKFSGNVTLRITNNQKGPDLVYHWGGKCKGTKVSSSRMSLMMRAMDKGYAVEIPAKPLSYDGRIIMCMQSVRVIKE